MKTLISAVVATFPVTAVGEALAQSGGMMNGSSDGMSGSGWMGGYGGYWMPVLLVAVVGFVAWIVMQRRK